MEKNLNLKQVQEFFSKPLEENTFLGSTKSQSLANAINSAMLQIDDSMSYTDFANAVALILIDEYGTHNFTPFMEVLHARLGMNESINETDDRKEMTIFIHKHIRK